MPGMRLTGLASGLDTEGIVSQLSEAYKTKVDNMKKQQTKVEWKKEAWKSLNTKIMDFYKGALSSFKSVSTYRKKAATGDYKGVKITASDTAVNGSHRVQVLNTATAQMWTGKKISGSTYTATSYKQTMDNQMKLSDVKDANGNSMESQLRNAKFTVTGADGVEHEISAGIDSTGNALGADATIEDMVNNINSQLEDAGIGAKVDFAAGNFRMSNTSAEATETEIENDTGEMVPTTTYSGGYDIKFVAADAGSAALFGIKDSEEGVTVPAMSGDADKDPMATIGGSQKLFEEVKTADSKVSGSTRLTDLGIAEGTEIKVNGNAITVDKSTTLSGLATQMAKLGIEANYDAGQGRFYLNSKGTGEDNAFTIEAVNGDGSASDALSKLGLDLQVGDEGRIDASNAEIMYNGVRYSQSNNTFDINGVTIEAMEKGDVQNFNVGTDSQAIYDKVKEFVKSYNDLIEEMNGLYNAERLKDFEPLTDDEKKAMSEDEVKKWEDKIKGSLLRRDDTISTLLSSMRTTLSKQVGVTLADGSKKNFTLSSFGINTSVYTEKGKLHIYGNKDDSDFADFDDALMKAINQNPEAVEKTLSTLGSEMYNNLMKAMAKSDISSALTFYADKEIDKEIKTYKDRVTNLQEKAQKEEDKYYNQFAKMEGAMAKLQAQQTYISQMFGVG